MRPLTKSETKMLVAEARKAKTAAHAPFSGFRVGAAVLSSSGRMYHGCNVENSSYGLTVCAERVALFTAIAEGEHSFRAIAVSADGDIPVPPCGACRQVISDLAGDVAVVIDAGTRGARKYQLKDLLPIAFGKKHLKPNRKRQ